MPRSDISRYSGQIGVVGDEISSASSTIHSLGTGLQPTHVPSTPTNTAEEVDHGGHRISEMVNLAPPWSPMKLFPHSAAEPDVRVSKLATLSPTAQYSQLPVDELTRAKEEQESLFARTIRDLREVLNQEKDEHTKDLTQVFRHIQGLEKTWVEDMRAKTQMEKERDDAVAQAEKAYEKALAQAEKKYADALALSKKKHADELTRETSGRAKLLTLMHAKTQRQKALLSHVKQALDERHEKALEHAKEEYKANARALAEKEHRIQLESVVQDSLSSAKEQQDRHDREIAQLLASNQALLLATNDKAQQQRERDADLARIADLKENLQAVTDENKKLVDFITEETTCLEELRKRQLEQKRKDLGDFFVEKKKNNKRR
jgi:hypothetical protein